MNRKAVFNQIGKGLAATLVVFVTLEVLLRIAYFARNSMVTEVPLPYAFGYDYGLIPPWLDSLRMLESDNVLVWKNRANIYRRYIDVFSPAHNERERTALLGFFPHLPDSLKGNPTWEISLNSEGFRDAALRRKSHHLQSAVWEYSCC